MNILVLEENDQVPVIHETKEISINYFHNGIQLNQHKINIDDNIFAYSVAPVISQNKLLVYL